MITDEMEQLYLGLKNVIGLTKLIGTGREIIPLKQEEVDFLTEFGKEKQVVEMSTGIIENGRIRITDARYRYNDKQVGISEKQALRSRCSGGSWRPRQAWKL